MKESAKRRSGALHPCIELPAALRRSAETRNADARRRRVTCRSAAPNDVSRRLARGGGAE
jgi:hypothetical protein